MKNKYVALAYRFFCFVFTLIGLLLHMNIFNGTFNLKQVMYYTIQSNILALVLFGILTYKTFVDIRKNGKFGSTGYLPRFEMVCVVDLLLTFVVYWVLLAPGAFNMGGDISIWSFDNLAVHLFVPLMCLADYFLFNEAGYLKYRDVYYVVIFPLIYVLFSTIAGFSGYVYRLSSVDGRAVRFPYFFIDWDEVGASGFIYIFVLVIFFLIISHILYWIDKKRMKKQK